MTDLKALRWKIAGIASDKWGEVDQSLEDIIESALLQYAEACLGEPSEGITQGLVRLHPLHKTLWQEMASQRLKEIK